MRSATLRQLLHVALASPMGPTMTTTATGVTSMKGCGAGGGWGWILLAQSTDLTTPWASIQDSLQKWPQKGALVHLCHFNVPEAHEVKRREVPPCGNFSVTETTDEFLSVVLHSHELPSHKKQMLLKRKAVKNLISRPAFRMNDHTVTQ